MDECRNWVTNAVGFCLLPCELIQSILFHLSLPEVIQMKLVNKTISHAVSDQMFVREYNSRSKTVTWLFVYMKRWRRDAVLHGFSDRRSCRWFKVSVAELLKQVVFVDEDVYFLKACGNFFLFASNAHRAVIAVNFVSKTVKKIPPCPLGPRGTSSWRRSGMKLVAEPTGSGHFRFLFAEMVENRPVLFEYDSRTDKWHTKEARDGNGTREAVVESDSVFLSVAHGPSESVVVAVGSQSYTPVVLRPRYVGGRNGGRHQAAVGFTRSNETNRLHVYGDGYMMVVRSDGVDHTERKITAIEIWGLSSNGSHWEAVSEVPSDQVEQIRKPYGVMMGCLEETEGTIRAVLMSNQEGLWDMIWLCYDVRTVQWSRVPLPEWKTKGSNMAGITFSSGLTLS